MRYLGIDYGEKRIGVAVSDPGGRMAFPLKIIFNNDKTKLLEQLKSLLEEEKISKIVVGLPLSLDGSETEQTKKTRNFVDILKGITSLSTDFENEILTTHMAESVVGKKEHTDAAAAAFILQSYLDRQKTV